jgi:ligand-binding SRPBCC domain-containing protein
VPQRLQASVEFSAPVERLFAILSVSARRVAVAPPEMQLQLVAAPEVLTIGAQIRTAARRFGMAFQLVSEITALEENAWIVETQRAGPFQAWELTQRFAALPDGRCRLEDVVVYEPPTGMLGLFLSPRVMEREITAGLSYRNRLLTEWLA